MEAFILILFAFVFFGVILPLFGYVVGMFCYYVLPYAFAVVVTVFLGLLAGINILFSWWVWVIGFVWASTVHLVRMRFRSLGMDVEHHHAAHAILLMGLPLQRHMNKQ